MKARVASGERLVFIDLETVLVGEERKIIQIAAIAVGPDLVPIESFEVKLRIVDKVIPLSYLSREPTIWKRLGRQPNDAAQRLAVFLRRHATIDRTSRIGKTFRVARLVAHNAEFDGPMLRDLFDSCGLFLPASSLVFCTLQRAHWFFHENQAASPPPNYKLGTLCEYFDVPLSADEAHDASSDVLATLNVYRSLSQFKRQRNLRCLSNVTSLEAV
jgi:hypothetical protein